MKSSVCTLITAHYFRVHLSAGLKWRYVLVATTMTNGEETIPFLNIHTSINLLRLHIAMS